jgi:hypothetical protein
MARTFHVRDMSARIIHTETRLYNEKEYNVILASGTVLTPTAGEDYIVTQDGSNLVTTQSGGRMILQ